MIANSFLRFTHNLFFIANHMASTKSPESHHEVPVAVELSAFNGISSVRHKARSHLLEYPILLEAHKATEEIKWPKPLVVFVGDSWRTVSNTQPFKYVIDFGDHCADESLVILDRWVPSLKTIECSDITDPVVQPVRSAHFLLVKVVFEPAAKHLNDTRILVHSVLNDTRISKTATKLTDPVIGTFNLFLDKAAEFVVPSIDMEPVGEVSELAKTKQKLSNLIRRKTKVHDVTPDATVGETLQAEN